MRDVLKSIFDNDYPGYPVFLDKVLRPIFGEELEVLPVKEDITSDIDREALKKANIKSIYRVAQIDSDTDVDIVEVFDVTLEDNAIISRSRVGIQRIIRSRVFQFTHAFMLFHYDNPEGRNWRFSLLIGSFRWLQAKRITRHFLKPFLSKPFRMSSLTHIGSSMLSLCATSQGRSMLRKAANGLKS